MKPIVQLSLDLTNIDQQATFKQVDCRFRSDGAACDFPDQGKGGDSQFRYRCGITGWIWQDAAPSLDCGPAKRPPLPH